MTTLPVPRLAALLRETARGVYATEAATELLIAHDRWLHRTDFLHHCVWITTAEGHDVPADELTGTVIHAGIAWDRIVAFAASAPCSGSEDRIRRLGAELAGYDTATPLAELLTGLDETNSVLVVDAIAHALRRPRTGTPAEAVMTVSDADLPLLQTAIADPGRYTPRATTDPVAWWEARAVLAALAAREAGQ